ncbi:MAG: tetratricopeptide repeat protein [Thermoanaerobaculia bacterium]
MGLPRGERPFLADPLAGYPLVPTPGPAEEVRQAHRALRRTGDAAAAGAVAEELLARDPSFQPARVLAAQADLVAGDADGAFEGAGKVLRSHPEYTAALLVRGRAGEELGRVAEAYAAYRSASDVSAAASGRSEALRNRAVTIVGNRFRSALDRFRFRDAAEHLERLEEWAPDEEVTLAAARALAAARGDREAELAAVERLLERSPESRDLRVRRAELELAVGDASRGLELLRRLADEYPDDPEIAESLEQAKFRWRLTLLPSHVEEIARKAELTRADFATLVHWLVPRVRTARGHGGRIAGDILEHPRREEITRVVNLGLMEVDATVHTFSPEDPVRRGRALETLLRAVESLGGPAGCLTVPLGPDPATEAVCAAAARCGLLTRPGECLPGATLSGAEALELIRHTLQLFTTRP